MSRRVQTLMLLAALSPAGCKNASGKADLPPAAGSGVAAPAIPAVEGPESDAGAGEAPASGALSGTGTLYARAEAQLGPKGSGTLAAVAVKEGDKVKKGQLLFRLDSSQADLSVRQAKTLLEAAEVGLRSAETDYKRTKELFDRGSVAPATFDQVQARYDAAKNSVAQAKVAVSMAQKASGDSAVRSPIDGVVTAKLKSVGETVTMMPPTVVLVVQDVTVIELRARLPERALATLAPGSTIRMRLPAIGVERTTQIKRINPAIDVLTRTVEVVAELDNADGVLKPGMLAEVEFGEPDAGASDAGPERDR